VSVAIVSALGFVDLVIRKSGHQLVLEKFSQLQLRFCDKPFVEFHILLAFAVKGQGFLPAVMDHLDRELQQIIDLLMSGTCFFLSSFCCHGFSSPQVCG
jgi:hypothetical protein